jgi:hypothetical protein
MMTDAARALAEGVGFEPTNDLRRCRFSDAVTPCDVGPR